MSKEPNGSFNLAVGGLADEATEKRLLEDLKKFVQAHPQIVAAGWDATSTGTVKLK